jgi:hypothetical protein
VFFGKDTHSWLTKFVFENFFSLFYIISTQRSYIYKKLDTNSGFSKLRAIIFQICSVFLDTPCALNTARSALSTVFTLPNNQKFGTQTLVTGSMKGVFETRPSLPRYSETWDVNVVLDYLGGLTQPVEQDLKC